jgi:hypothetical protein
MTGLYGALNESLFGQAQDNGRQLAEAKFREARRGYEQQTQQTATTAQVWGNWNVRYFYASTGSTETTATDGTIGQTWIVDSTQATGTTWVVWNTQYMVYNGDRPPVPAQIPFSPEQLEEQRLARERARAARLAKEAKQAEAHERARVLLREFLDEQQRDTLDKHRWFEVVSPAGRRYRIHQGRQGNVYLIEGGHQVMRYCIHPSEWVPDEDTMLAQALMVRCAEDDFVNIANKTPLRAAA